MGWNSIFTNWNSIFYGLEFHFLRIEIPFFMGWNSIFTDWNSIFYGLKFHFLWDGIPFFTDWISIFTDWHSIFLWAGIPFCLGWISWKNRGKKFRKKRKNWEEKMRRTHLWWIWWAVQWPLHSTPQPIWNGLQIPAGEKDWAKWKSVVFWMKKGKNYVQSEQKNEDHVFGGAARLESGDDGGLIGENSFEVVGGGLVNVFNVVVGEGAGNGHAVSFLLLSRQPLQLLRPDHVHLHFLLHHALSLLVSFICESVNTFDNRFSIR